MRTIKCCIEYYDTTVSFDPTEEVVISEIKIPDDSCI